MFASKKKTLSGGFRLSRARTNTPAHRSTPNLLSVAFNMLMASPADDCQQRTYNAKLLLTLSDARMESAAEAADVMGSKFSNSRFTTALVCARLCNWCLNNRISCRAAGRLLLLGQFISVMRTACYGFN